MKTLLNVQFIFDQDTNGDLLTMEVINDALEKQGFEVERIVKPNSGYSIQGFFVKRKNQDDKKNFDGILTQELMEAAEKTHWGKSYIGLPYKKFSKTGPGSTSGVYEKKYYDALANDAFIIKGSFEIGNDLYVIYPSEEQNG